MTEGLGPVATGTGDKLGITEVRTSKAEGIREVRLAHSANLDGMEKLSEELGKSFCVQMGRRGSGDNDTRAFLFTEPVREDSADSNMWIVYTTEGARGIIPKELSNLGIDGPSREAKFTKMIANSLRPVSGDSGKLSRMLGRAQNLYRTSDSGYQTSGFYVDKEGLAAAQRKLVLPGFVGKTIGEEHLLQVDPNLVKEALRMSVDKAKTADQIEAEARQQNLEQAKDFNNVLNKYSVVHTSTNSVQ